MGRVSVSLWLTLLCERGAGGGRVHVLVEARDPAVADGEDVRPVAAVLAAGLLHAPAVGAERDDLVALRDELARLEADGLLRLGQLGEEAPDALAPAARAGERDAFDLRQTPVHLFGQRIENARDVAATEVVVRAAHHGHVFLLTHTPAPLEVRDRPSNPRGPARTHTYESPSPAGCHPPSSTIRRKRRASSRISTLLKKT